MHTYINVPVILHKLITGQSAFSGITLRPSVSREESTAEEICGLQMHCRTLQKQGRKQSHLNSKWDLRKEMPLGSGNGSGCDLQFAFIWSRKCLQSVITSNTTAVTMLTLIVVVRGETSTFWKLPSQSTGHLFILFMNMYFLMIHTAYRSIELGTMMFFAQDFFVQDFFFTSSEYISQLHLQSTITFVFLNINFK